MRVMQFAVRGAVRLLCMFANHSEENQTMESKNEYDDYRAELREAVCSRCIERQPDGPPCAPQGKACGIEQYVPELVEICRNTDSVQMEPYMQQLHDEICKNCAYRDGPTCPCPLDYLLPLAVEAIERVQQCKAGRPPARSGQYS